VLCPSCCKTIFISKARQYQIVFVFLSEHARSEQKNENDQELIKRLAVNRSVHRWSDKLTLVVINWLKFIRSWYLCCESQSCSDIHDKVYPEEHHRAEWTVSNSSCTQNDTSKARNCDSKLTLKELSAIVKNIVTPPGCIEYTQEVVIHDNNSCLISHDSSL